MSGLVSFFRDYLEASSTPLPSADRLKAKDQNNKVLARHKAEKNKSTSSTTTERNVDYNMSLQALVEATDLSHQHQSRRGSPGQRGSSSLRRKHLFRSAALPSSSASSTDRQSNRHQPQPSNATINQQYEWTPQRFTFDQWREFQKESLTIYMAKRLTEQEDEKAHERPNAFSSASLKLPHDSNPMTPNQHVEQDDASESWTDQSDDDDDGGEADVMDEEQPNANGQVEDLPHTQEDSLTPILQKKIQNSSNDSKTQIRIKRRDKKKRIPHLRDTLPLDNPHCFCYRIQDINLYTNQIVSLSLCRIERIWKLRDTKRCTKYPLVATTTTQCGGVASPVYPARMPRCPFGIPTIEEDGPLSSCYRHVVSLEVVQLLDQHQLEQQQQQQKPLNGHDFATKCNIPSFPPKNINNATAIPMIGRSNNPPTRKRRLRVFLYNSYAKSFQNWLDQLGHASKRGPQEICSTSNSLFMSFHHVPALCILPFAIDPQNWIDKQQLMNYCICIGDTSSLRISVDALSSPISCATNISSQEQQSEEYPIPQKYVRVRMDEHMMQYEQLKSTPLTAPPPPPPLQVRIITRTSTPEVSASTSSKSNEKEVNYDISWSELVLSRDRLEQAKYKKLRKQQRQQPVLPVQLQPKRTNDLKQEKSPSLVAYHEWKRRIMMATRPFESRKQNPLQKNNNVEAAIQDKGKVVRRHDHATTNAANLSKSPKNQAVVAPKHRLLLPPTPTKPTTVKKASRPARAAVNMVTNIVDLTKDKTPRKANGNANHQHPNHLESVMQPNEHGQRENDDKGDNDAIITMQGSLHTSPTGCRSSSQIGQKRKEMQQTTCAAGKEIHNETGEFQEGQTNKTVRGQDLPLTPTNQNQGIETPDQVIAAEPRCTQLNNDGTVVPASQSNVENQISASNSKNKRRKVAEAKENATLGLIREASFRIAKRSKVNAPTEYIKLSNLRDAFQRQIESERRGHPCSINIYGVVIGFASPSRTKRGDWMVAASIVDDSMSTNSDGENASSSHYLSPVTLLMFSKGKEKLPKLQQVGDILRMHRVTLQEFKGDIQILGKIPTSYVVVRQRPRSKGEPSHPMTNGFQEDGSNERESWSILPTASSVYTFTADDEMRSKELWTWGRDRIWSHPTIHPEHRCTLEDLARAVAKSEHMDKSSSIHQKVIDDIDLTAMVSAVIPYPAPGNQYQKGNPLGFLRVWDGTGMSRSDCLPIISLEDDAETMRQSDPPSEAVIKIASVLREFQNRQTARNDDASESSSSLSSYQPPKSLCGLVANLVIWEESHWHLVNECIKVGCFIRLRNVEVRRWGELGSTRQLLCIMVHSKSWLSPLPDMSYEVHVLLLRHNERVFVRRDTFNPDAGFLPLPMMPSNTPATISVPGARVPLNSDDVGTGMATSSYTLSTFASDLSLTKFIGLARIEGTIPKIQGDIAPLCRELPNGTGYIYHFAVLLQDDANNDTTITALVQDQVAKTLFSMSASEAMLRRDGSEAIHCKDYLDKKFLWNVNIQSVNYQGARYFVLAEISMVSV